MTQPATPDEAIAENVLAPKKVSVAGETIEEYSIDELVKASQHLASQQAASAPGFGLRFQKIVTRYPGSC